MADHPILFQGAMVRALLAGAKTQTRRAIRPQASSSSDQAFVGQDGIWRFSHPTARGPVSHEADDVRCPYGQPGDRLWVREVWAPEQYDSLAESVREIESTLNKPAYRADWDATPTRLPAYNWKPSIHMPRAASRILLEVTEVRVQRLQEISEEDAQAEGAEPYLLPVHPAREGLRHVDGYAQLWDSINGKTPGAAWADNPWVWAVSFKRV